MQRENPALSQLKKYAQLKFPAKSNSKEFMFKKTNQSINALTNAFEAI